MPTITVVTRRPAGLVRKPDGSLQVSLIHPLVLAHGVDEKDLPRLDHELPGGSTDLACDRRQDGDGRWVMQFKVPGGVEGAGDA